MERFILFGLFTAMMLYATKLHIDQQRRGEFRGHPWPFQVVTDRARSPRRFAILKLILGALFIAVWIGWIFLFRAMLGE